MINLVISGSVTIKSGKRFHSMMPKGKHELSTATKEQVIGRILHVLSVRADV